MAAGSGWGANRCTSRVQAERVLVLGATNRPEVLDAALVRPGRFDRIINMGNPTADNRYRILCVHARGKQIPRDNDDALLREAAARSGGFSGADLANLLNEAAILQVCAQVFASAAVSTRCDTHRRWQPV